MSSHQHLKPCTLNLFHSSHLHASSPPPLACRNLKTMSCNGKAPKLDLSLNLSPPRANQELESPIRSPSPPPPASPPSSCISSDNTDVLNSPETTSMILVGCPRCLMYVMLSEEDPKCPKCKSTVLLDFMHDNTVKKKTRKN